MPHYGYRERNGQQLCRRDEEDPITMQEPINVGGTGLFVSLENL